VGAVIEGEVVEVTHAAAVPRCGEPMRIIACILDPPDRSAARRPGRRSTRPEIDQTGDQGSWD
jgi:hypothetical protein